MRKSISVSIISSSLITVYGSLLTEILSSAIEPVLVILGPTFRRAMLLHHVTRLNHARHEVVLLDESPRRKRFCPREQSAGVTVVAQSRPLCPWPHIPGRVEGRFGIPGPIYPILHDPQNKYQTYLSMQCCSTINTTQII